MRGSMAFSVVIGLVLAMSLPNASLAGEEDPDLGDTVLGTVGGIRYASDTASHAPGSGYADARAGCGGSRWHAIGGGAVSGGSASAGLLSAMRTEDGLDPDTKLDDGFYAGGLGPEGAVLTVHSICVRDAETAYRQQAIANQPSSRRHGSVACGAARWHVASGSTFIATTGSWVVSSFPTDGGDAGTTPDDGWAGTAHDTNGGTGGFSVYAVCVAGLDLRYVRGTTSSVPPGQVRARQVSCPATQHVVGGGVRVSGATDSVRLGISAPLDGPDAGTIPDDGWRIRVTNPSGSSVAVTPFAVCVA